MEEINHRAIEFFRQVKNQFKKDDKGEIDYSTFDKSSEEFKYICSKMPEFFMRNRSIFEIFDAIYYQSSERDLPYDELLFARMMDNGFVDIENFKRDYPVIKALAEDIYKRISEAKRTMWEKGLILPQGLQEEVNRFPDIYQSIIANNGEYNNYSLRQLESLLENSKGEERRLRAFIYEIRKYYDGINSGELFDQEKDNTIIHGRKAIDESRQRLKDLERRRNEIQEQLQKFGFFDILLSSKKRQKRKSLRKELRGINDNILERRDSFESNCIKQNIKEYENEIIDNYKNFYKENIWKPIVREIKEDYKDSEYNDMLDKLLWYLMSSRKEPYAKEKLLMPFVTMGFDDYIVAFKNALRNIEGLANTFLAFEELENKDLYSFLDIAMKEIMRVPFDSEHGVVSNKYRDISLRAGNQFFSNVANPKDIPEMMESLNKDFKALLQIEDAEEYVRKAGELWYRFILIHPYLDGNGRIGRYLLSVLLAHKGFIIPSLYNSKEKGSNLFYVLDNYALNNGNMDMVGVKILNSVRDVALDLSGKKRLSKKNSRQSDVWGINKDPNEIDYPLSVILDRKNRITKPLKIFTNCSSKFIINGREIERYIGTVIVSKEIDLSLSLMSGENYYDVLEKTTDFLYENGIPYIVISGKDIDLKQDDNDIPETWFIREGYVLNESLDNSRNNGCEECILYLNTKSRLMVGYYTDNNDFHEVWGLHFKGLITTNNSWSLLIDEKDPRNINMDDAIKIIEEQGFSYTVGDNPFEEIKKK